MPRLCSVGSLPDPISKWRYNWTESQLTISPPKRSAIRKLSSLLPEPVGPTTATSAESPMYYYSLISLQAATILVGQPLLAAAGLLAGLFGCGSAAVWGRLASIGEGRKSAEPNLGAADRVSAPRVR